MSIMTKINEKIMAIIVVWSVHKSPKAEYCAMKSIVSKTKHPNVAAVYNKIDFLHSYPWSIIWVPISNFTWDIAVSNVNWVPGYNPSNLIPSINSSLLGSWLSNLKPRTPRATWNTWMKTIANLLGAAKNIKNIKTQRAIS